MMHWNILCINKVRKNKEAFIKTIINTFMNETFTARFIRLRVKVIIYYEYTNSYHRCLFPKQQMTSLIPDLNDWQQCINIRRHLPKF